MTDSIDEKPTPRRNRLNSQAENFDFDLVEMQVTPDQEAPEPSALGGFVTDNLFVDNTESQQPTPEHPTEPDSFITNKPTTLIAPAQVIPDIKTNFYVDYFDQRKPVKTAKTKPAPVENTTQPSTVEDRSQDTMTTEHTAETPAESFNTDDEDVHAPVFNGAGVAVAALSQFKSKQERVNKQQEDLIHEFSEQVKKAKSVTYTAVFFGAAALVAAAALGVMLLQTKSEISDLAGTTTAIKDDIRNIAKVTPDDMEGTDPSIDLLNQRVDEVVEQLNEVTAHQNKTSGSEKNAKQAANTPVEKPALTAKPAAEPSEKPVVTAKAETAKHQSNTPATVAEKKAAPETAAKAAPATKAVKNTAAEPAEPVVKVTTGKPEDTTKAAGKTGVYAPKKLSDIPDKAMQVPANDINKVVNAAATTAAANQKATATPAAPQAATGKSQTSAGWTVNLGSSNKLDEAKSTAARFTQKGIPVTISSATVKNVTRYRLQVKGFKTKDEAAAYADKAKNTLNLNSVWINP
ncbi:MAG: SPOR domain-containing protein [Methylococcales bacterium]|nr:SPOR domain-containing protein [Methylococcales bacterium]